MRDIALSNMENEMKELQLKTVEKTIEAIKLRLYQKDRLYIDIVHSKEAYNILLQANGEKLEKLITTRRHLQEKACELWNIIKIINETTKTIENKIKEDKL